MTRPDPTPKPDPDDAPAPSEGFALSTLGFEFALGIVVLGALGWWADGAIGWRDTFPVLLVTGILTGFTWGIWRLRRRLNGRRPPKP